jgi:hypothetical protein
LGKYLVSLSVLAHLDSGSVVTSLSGKKVKRP